MVVFLILNKAGEGSTPDEIYRLSKKLKAEKAFNYARRILVFACKTHTQPDEFGLLLDQQYALCTYKDQDLPTIYRLEEALRILREWRPKLDSKENNSIETFGLGGAVYKRKWETDGQLKNLEYSLYYYKKGYELGAEKNDGYCGINTAFVLDLLSQIETANVLKSAEQQANAKRYMEQAREIRQVLIEKLVPQKGDTNEVIVPEKNWWYLVTVAEAYFGLGEYENARPWLKKASTLTDTSEWEKETTTRQLARIALLHDKNELEEVENSVAWDVLTELIEQKNETAALQSAFFGKMGLALSGGGLRASLYHIGVLARLAELDMLRKIEVLSCVSGGSIIGAHFYLEVRKLLQTKPDASIIQNDYIEIIKKINIDFLAGIQRNIRTRVISNWWDNFRMFWSKTYSRTSRLGELYESELFSKTEGWNQNEDQWLHNLVIAPKQDDGSQKSDFNPKYDNWKRNAKVPILILNATALNTGHNWQFTASWMGESPASIQKIDGNYRLRRMYYKEDGDKAYVRTVRLGHAVAASSCVPGMFEPFALPNLYPDKILKLVDGGVHDNQGICGLLEEDCSVILVGDASGQMGEIDKPGGDILSVPLRANNILMERVRNAQFQDMNSRSQAGLLKGFMFIHLKMGLDVKAIDWVNCEDPSDVKINFATTTAYDIRKDIQKYLAASRTDLDSFNETEAHALMCSGYLMTKFEYNKCIKGFNSAKEQKINWDFLEIANDLKRADTSREVIKLLEVSKENVFKIWRLIPALKVLAWALLIICIVGFILGIYHWYDTPILTVGKIGWFVFYLIIGLFISKTVIRIIKYRETAIRFVTGIGLITFGWLAANIHLYVFDKMYLKKGKRK